MPGLNIVALISGGKDSFFSMLHCQANGHKIIALANLHPPARDQDGAVDDLESFMYQTIGHKVIPCYEQALGLPLYRQDIVGEARYRNKDYAADCLDDETESLLPLLRQVIAAHPEVNAVSTGAILSDYQRTRVESVALRLGLTPLSYLWQWPFLPPGSQASLLEDMAAVGQDARIIKVASGGLDESFLWANVADPRTIARLTKASQKFGSPEDGAVLGEGGEYETLAIGGPAPLWKGRIHVPEDCVEVIPGEAGSASVRISNPSVELSDTSEKPLAAPRAPPLLESQFEELRTTVCSADHDSSYETNSPEHSLQLDHASGNLQLLENITGQGKTAPEQTKSIMERIKTQLSDTLSGATYSIIVLRNMSDFAAVNAIYGSYFTRPNPPARVTIACADVLPDDALLSISITVSPEYREGLHVQSRSYWAPANIGPYSQAIKHTVQTGSGGAESYIYIAGQIPLIPATMQLPPETAWSSTDFILLSVLALQHLHRIGRVMHVKHWSSGIAFIASEGVNEEELALRASIARRTWTGYFEQDAITAKDPSEPEDENFDVWHLTHGSGKPWIAQVHADPSGGAATEPTSTAVMPRLLVITSDSLPRNASIEWVGFGSSRLAENDEMIPPHLRSLVKAFQHRILPSKSRNPMQADS